MKRTEHICRLLPALEETHPISLGENEVIITFAGFEDRCLAAAKILSPGATGKAIVLTYKPHDARNDFDGLARELTSKGLSIKDANIIAYDRFNPHPFADNLKRCLSAMATAHVVLDISAMSKLAVLLCLDVCRELNLSVTAHYAEAIRYGPSKVAYEKAKAEQSIHRPSIQIYSGVRGVLRVARFSSVAMQGQPTAAIAFMSFNEELIQALLNCVYPARLFMINSKPPRLRWREAATAWIHEPLLKEWPALDNPVCDGLPLRTASTLDYRHSFAIMRDLYWELTVDHRVLLAPTGSKMQAVGCYLLTALHPDVHVEYPTPQGFLDLYSEGIGRQWIVRLGRLASLSESLNRAERKERLDVPTRQLPIRKV
jgi:hypothetical protein